LDNSLKQRVVGAIVLVALAVIFLPPLLKESPHNKHFKSKIPEPPADVKQLTSKLEVGSESVADKASLAASENNDLPDELLDENSDKLDLSPPRPVKDRTQHAVAKDLASSDDTNVDKTLGKQFKSAAYVLQVASFSSVENATKLVNRLKSMGFKAYQRASTPKNGKAVHRVLVGPYINKKQAHEVREKIANQAKLEGIIKVYDPITE